MLFDPEIESKFHIVAGAFLDKYKSGQPQAPNIVTSALTYAHSKVFGIKDQTEHDEREKV